MSNPITKIRKLVRRMDVEAVSVVQTGAVPASNVPLVIQQAPEATIATPDPETLLAIWQQGAEDLVDAPELSGKMEAIDRLATALRTAVVPAPEIAQAADESSVQAELNEARARAGGWDAWQAFREYLGEHCETQADVLGAVDQFAGILKAELLAPGDADGDEAPFQANSAAPDGDQAALTMQTATAAYAAAADVLPDPTPQEAPAVSTPLSIPGNGFSEDPRGGRRRVAQGGLPADFWASAFSRAPVATAPAGVPAPSTASVPAPPLLAPDPVAQSVPTPDPAPDVPTAPTAATATPTPAEVTAIVQAAVTQAVQDATAPLQAEIAALRRAGVPRSGQPDGEPERAAAVAQEKPDLWRNSPFAALYGIHPNQ